MPEENKETDHVWECEYCGKTYETKGKCDEHEKECSSRRVKGKMPAIWLHLLLPLLLGIVGAAIVHLVLSDRPAPLPRKVVKVSWILAILITMIPIAFLLVYFSVTSIF